LKKNNFLKELTVLYVEDEQYVREEIEDMLSIKVHKLLTASNGQEALDIYEIEKNQIDIIITDIQMPVMNGLDFINNVRKDNQDIPIIITTAFNEIEFLKKAIDLHVDKYITKPIDIVQLFTVINRASLVLEQKKKINQRDLIIQTILDLKPYYSLLIDKNNLSKVAKEILERLDFFEDDILEVKFQNETKPNETINTIEKLIEKISSLQTNPEVIEFLYLENKSKKDIKYIIKPYFFDKSELFVLSFFESDKIDYTGNCFECMDNNPDKLKR